MTLAHATFVQVNLGACLANLSDESMLLVHDLFPAWLCLSELFCIDPLLYYFSHLVVHAGTP